MRIFGPYIFIFVGLVIGALATFVFTSNPMRMAPNIVLGILGSFFGLWVRDVLDITAGGNMTGALIAAALGALLLTVPANIYMTIKNKEP